MNEQTKTIRMTAQVLFEEEGIKHVALRNRESMSVVRYFDELPYFLEGCDTSIKSFDIPDSYLRKVIEAKREKYRRAETKVEGRGSISRLLAFAARNT